MASHPRLDPAAPAEYLTIGQDATLREVVERFRRHHELRLLAVLDGQGWPIGVLREVDVRDLLFNPFGHALLRNPSFGDGVAQLVRPVTVADHDTPLPELLAMHSDNGVALVRRGTFVTLLDPVQLLRMATAWHSEASTLAEARSQRIHDAASAFEAGIMALANDIGEACTAIAQVATELDQRAGATHGSAASVATAAHQTAIGMVDIEQRGRALAQSIERITCDTDEADRLREQANAAVERTGTRVQALSEVATTIEAMLTLIRGLAQQTNLLALNAGIEAARAGAAGTGFAVVAGEVKSLARQTDVAAGDIARRVDAVHALLGDVGNGQQAVQQAIAAIGRITTTIGTAVAAERETTQAIAVRVEEARGAGADIDARVGAIATAADGIGDRAGMLARLVDGLSGLSRQLQGRASALVSAVG